MGQPYLPARRGQPQAMGEALGPVVVHELGQAGEGHGLMQVQPAGPLPDLVMPYGLPVPHWGGGGGWGTREQACVPWAPHLPERNSQARGVSGHMPDILPSRSPNIERSKRRPTTSGTSLPGGPGLRVPWGGAGMSWMWQPNGGDKPEGPSSPHAGRKSLGARRPKATQASPQTLETVPEST